MAKRSRNDYMSEDYEEIKIQMPLDESYDPENGEADYDAFTNETPEYDFNEYSYYQRRDPGQVYQRQGSQYSHEINTNDYNERNRTYADEYSAGEDGYPDGYSTEQWEESDDQIRQRKIDKKKQPKQVKNKQIMGILYGFLVIFLATIGYFIYFDVIESEEALSNPNNIRVAKMADTVTRGRIMSADGAILAETRTDSDGGEYRNYPYNEMFAHVVGMSSTNKSGIESFGEYYLLTSSINPMQKAYNDLIGEKSAGDDVWTTLDTQLQRVAYEAFGNQQGVVVAMEPSTGRMLCMVSKPDYNPNTLAQNYEAIINDPNSKVLLNQALNGLFTPGSIFKIVTTLEYVREYPNYANYSYNCNGSITLASEGGDAELTCFARHIHGTQNLVMSFANSCNASYANIGLNLNINNFNQLCETMFFNQNLPTNIPHSQSTFSLDSDACQWQIGAAAIGQGQTQITPLHALMLTSAVANGGVVMKPYLIDSIRSAGGSQVERFTSQNGGSIMTTSEANLIKEMMQSVVSRGTATSLNNLGYTIAGKTGTAENDNAGNNAWFVGFAPADQPKIAICVLVADTQASGSEAAVPIARQLFADYLSR